ncbi:tetratricopeptide repeat protein [Luteimonas sp. A501]
MRILVAVVLALLLVSSWVAHSAEPLPADVERHYAKGLSLAKRGKLEAAEKEFTQAIQAVPESSEFYKHRGNTRYSLKNYPGAIEDFNVYLTATPGDATMVLLRGIAKSLLNPEDVPGACADFYNIRSQLADMGLEKYCTGQSDW